MFGFGEDEEYEQQAPKRSFGSYLWNALKIAGAIALAIFTLVAFNDTARDKLDGVDMFKNKDGVGLGTRLRNVSDATKNTVVEMSNSVSDSIGNAVNSLGGKVEEKKEDVSGVIDTAKNVGIGTVGGTAAALTAKAAYNRYGSQAMGTVDAKGEFHPLSRSERKAYNKQVKLSEEIKELEAKRAFALNEARAAYKDKKPFDVALEEATEKNNEKTVREKLKPKNIKETYDNAKGHINASQEAGDANDNFRKYAKERAKLDKQIAKLQAKIDKIKKEDLPKDRIMSRFRYEHSPEGKRFMQASGFNEYSNIGTGTPENGSTSSEHLNGKSAAGAVTSDSKAVVPHVIQQGGTVETPSGKVVVVGHDGKVVADVTHLQSSPTSSPQPAPSEHPTNSSAPKTGVRTVDIPGMGPTEVADTAHKPTISPETLLAEAKPQGLLRKLFSKIWKPATTAAVAYTAIDGGSQAMAALGSGQYDKAAREIGNTTVQLGNFILPPVVDIPKTVIEHSAGYVGDAARKAFDERELAGLLNDKQDQIAAWRKQAKELGMKEIPDIEIMRKLNKYNSWEKPLDTPVSAKPSDKPLSPTKG